MKKIIIIFLGVIIPFILFIMSITLLSNMSFFYSYEFDKLVTIKEVGIEATSQEVAEMMVDFIKGNRDEFQITAPVKGVERDLFNSKEQIHMEDVRQLISLGKVISIVGIAVSSLLYIFIFFKDKKELRNVYKIAMGLYFLFILFMAIVSFADFNEGFTIFHELFFSNDLWLLNPKEDILIMIMPLEFFMDALKIALFFNTFIMIILGVVTWKITKPRKRLFQY